MPFDAPNPLEYRSYLQHVVDGRDATQRLQSELIVIRGKGAGTNMNENDTTKTQELVDHGQIDRMTLPHGWEASRSQDGVVGSSTYKDFCPPDNKEVKMAFFFRGRPVSEYAATTFHTLLAKAPHILTPSEIKSVGEILRDRQDPADFSMLSAHTESLNGKMALVVEGRYKQIQQDTYAVMIDADGTGKFVQEIYFQAPKDEYARRLKDARQSIKSIHWK